jgi:hypothetical protein
VLFQRANQCLNLIADRQIRVDELGVNIGQVCPGGIQIKEDSPTAEKRFVIAPEGRRYQRAKMRKELSFAADPLQKWTYVLIVNCGLIPQISSGHDTPGLFLDTFHIAPL